MRVGGDAIDAAVVHAPLAVLPTPFPRSLYHRVSAPVGFGLVLC